MHACIRLHKEQYEDTIADFRTTLEQAKFKSTDGDVRALCRELKRAEAAVKRSKMKNYYKILGVPHDCNEADIKKAYRCKSLKHHQDKVRNPRVPSFISHHTSFYRTSDGADNEINIFKERVERKTC
jgi:hypothetical protein